MVTCTTYACECDGCGTTFQNADPSSSICVRCGEVYWYLESKEW